jgi:O-antigen/teichoic acid export membrane protein
VVSSGDIPFVFLRKTGSDEAWDAVGGRERGCFRLGCSALEEVIRAVLLRHVALYVLARGLPGLVSLIAIVIYSRLVTPGAYGQFALVIAGAGLADLLFFQWLRLGVVRLLPVYEGRRTEFLSSVTAGFLVLTALSAMLTGILVELIADSTIRWLVLFGSLLLVSGALLGLLLEISRIELAPLRFAAIACSQAVLSLASAIMLILLGLDVWALLGGTVLGTLIPALTVCASQRRSMWLAQADTAILRQLIVYGTPLIATQALSLVVDSSDRFLIAWLLDEDAVGRYTVSYVFAQSSIGVLFAIINMAAYPLAVRALEEHGEDAARIRLRKTLTSLLAIGLPATSGLVLVAENVAAVLLGEAFRDEAPTIIPLIGIAVFLGGIRAFYFDLSFQLSRKTVRQIWVPAVAATVNVILNLFWIPVFGTVGAAYATLVALGVALLLSAALGARVFRLPAPDREVSKLVLATGGMVLGVWPFAGLTGPGWLALQVLLGTSIYALLLWLMDVSGIRQSVSSLLPNFSGRLRK